MEKAKIRCMVILLLVGLLSHSRIAARVRPDTLMLKRVFSYKERFVTTHAFEPQITYTYQRSTFKINKRNIILLAVPSMYAVAHGGNREYITEDYNKVTFDEPNVANSKTLVRFTTIPHKRRTLPNLLKYLTLRIYDETMIENSMLSPFNRNNKIYYRYKVSFLFNGTARIEFRPKTDNTQLLRGYALVDYETGRIRTCKLQGEYDMVRFELLMNMNKGGYKSLLPVDCDLNATFKFLGNNTSAHYKAYYLMPQLLNDSLNNSNDYPLIERVRPDTLLPWENKIYDRYFEEKRRKDSIESKQEKKKDAFKTIMWDFVGDHLVNRIKRNFGTNNQGYLRINPLLNPLYLEYSHLRGLTYKFDVRMSYNFSAEQELSLRVKAGYSLNQHYFYYQFPLMYYYNKKRNGYILVESGNGNKIRNTLVVDILRTTGPYTANWDAKNVDVFDDKYLKIVNNNDLSDKWSLQVGVITHKRMPVNREPYEKSGNSITYRTLAPLFELEYRPMGWKGPIIALDYERSIANIRASNIQYERWELDGQYLLHLKRLQTVSMRLGSGVYTNKNKDSYFLDFTNFRENNIPGGWNDEWSGEFELLSSYWYNNSNYYVRTNVTYETPMLLASWIPGIGHFMETERLYVSALSVKHLCPYAEFGYGFTTRLFSLGLFVANKKWKFDGFGCKVGFELFRHW